MKGINLKYCREVKMSKKKRGRFGSRKNFPTTGTHTLRGPRTPHFAPTLETFESQVPHHCVSTLTHSTD